MFRNKAYKIAKSLYEKYQNVDPKSLLRGFYFAFDKYPKFVGYFYKLFIFLVIPVGLFFNAMLFKDFPCVIISGAGKICSIYVFAGMFIVINLFILAAIFVSLIFYYVGRFLLKK